MSAPLRVLVVDDDFLVAKVHTQFVEQADGFEVVGTCADGAATIAAAARLLPDLILLDVHLPDVSGMEVLRRLRAEGVGAEVLVVTAERDGEVIHRARAAGACGYLVKPFTQDDLHSRLADIRRTRTQLADLAMEHEPAQADIDRVFGAAATRPDLPKGLNRQTADLVLAALDDGEQTAAACAGTIGLARVTARRYLEHFVETGQATARQQYGKVGRPERLYVRA